MRPAESLHRPDTRDIGSIPPEEPRPLFDPQRDIPPEITAEYRKDRCLPYDWLWYQALYPDQREQFLYQDERVKKNNRRAMAGHRQDGNISGLIISLAEECALYPEERTQIIEKGDWERMRGYLSSTELRLAFLVKFLFPDKPLLMSDEFLRKKLQEGEDYLQKLLHARSNGIRTDINPMEDLAIVRLFRPELLPPLTPERIEQYKIYCRTPWMNRRSCLESYAYLAILTATTAEIRDGQFILTRKAAPEPSAAPELPVTKAF